MKSKWRVLSRRHLLDPDLLVYARMQAKQILVLGGKLMHTDAL